MPRLWKQLLSLVLGLALAAAAWLTVRPMGRLIEGSASVTDGDSLRVGGTEIRLKGVDAPELHQTCGRHGQPYRCGDLARTELIEFLRGRALTCRVSGRDRYGRALAFCAVDGQDLGAWLVGRGLAVGYRDYEREEARARSRSLGLWRGEFRRPAEWRRENASPG
jgi:endonuclease YncB( thermonuclease family)